MKRPILFILALLATGPGAWGAELVHLTDGSTRRGRVEKWDDQGVQLRVEGDGIRVEMLIPATKVARVEWVADLPVVSAAQSAAAPKREIAAPFGALARMSETAEQGDLSRRMFGGEPVVENDGDPATATAMNAESDAAFFKLSPRMRELWKNAREAETANNKPAVLEALRGLEGEAGLVRGGLEAVNNLCKVARGGESFGEWMGKVHAEVADAGFRGGLLDLTDVREVERAAMLGRLQEKAGAALEPVRGLYPPLNGRTGFPLAYRRGQMEGITLSNAIEVKEKTAHAVALLAAQVKLSPEMPFAHRLTLLGELAAANRVLWRARELEPAARMARERTVLEQRKALVRQQHDEAKQRQRVAVAMFGR